MKKGFRILKFKKDRPIFEIKDLSRQFNEEMNALYREMDTRINDHAVQLLKETNEGIAREIEDIYRMVDSRLDKLENKLTNS